MSITVAVNAADSAKGPETVCQSAEHNNCGENNGSGGDDDDLSVLEHEKDQNEQVKLLLRKQFLEQLDVMDYCVKLLGILLVVTTSNAIKHTSKVG